MYYKTKTKKKEVCFTTCSMSMLLQTTFSVFFVECLWKGAPFHHVLVIG